MTHADVDLNMKLSVLVLNHHESLSSIYRFRGFQPPTFITNIPGNNWYTQPEAGVSPRLWALQYLGRVADNRVTVG